MKPACIRCEEREMVSNHLCNRCYERAQVSGDMPPPMFRGALPPEVGSLTELPDRLTAKFITDESGCWLWIGETSEGGYGRVRWYGQRKMAHRLSYELLVGAIPDGLQLDHLCRVRNCINPEHLEAVTPRENLIRGTGFVAENAAKTHCPQGHPYAGENLAVYDGYRARWCRTCKRANDRKNQAARRARLRAVKV